MIKRVCCFLILCGMLFVQTAFATTTGVTVTPGAQLYSEDSLLVDLNITFTDTSLYSDQVYLAYRVVDQAGEMVVTESPRTPITLKEDGTAFVTVDVSTAAVPELLNIESGELIFDFVDQKNGYWFSDRALVEYVGEPVVFEKAKLGTGLVQEETTDQEQLAEAEQIVEQKEGTSIDPLSAVLNGLAWIFVIVVLFKSGILKKKVNHPHRDLTIQSTASSPVLSSYKKDWRIECLLGIMYLCVPFLLYWREIWGNISIVSGDGMNAFYSFTYLKKLLQAGELPLWNPYLAGGMPQGIMVGGYGLYPIKWLVVFFPQSIQFELYLGIHLAIGGVFLYKYLRRISCSQLVSGAVSTMYIFTVHMGGARKEHIELILTALYVPVLFYFAERYLQERKLKWLFCCSAAMALQFLGGFLQYVIYVDIVMFFYLLIAGIHRRLSIVTMLKHGMMWVLTYFALIMGAVLGTVQFMLLLFGNSGEQISFELFTGLSLHPIKLLMSIFPEIFGENVWIGLMSKGNYTSGMDIELVLGAAVVCVLLASFSLWKKSFYCRFMTGLLVGALVYACLGQFEFLANIIYHIPILNMFRIPSRTLFLFSFAEMVLVALSLEALWKEEKHHTVLHHVNLAVAVGCVMVFLLYRQDMIPYDEKLPVDQVFLIPCALFAVYLLVFYGFYFLCKKGMVSKRVGNVGIVMIAVATMLVQVMPYYTFAYLIPIQSTMNLPTEFVDEVGTYKIWTPDGSCGEIVSNSAIVYPVQSLNAYTNFNLPYLYQYAESTALAPMNSSGLYNRFEHVEDILQTKNNLMSIMGAKYLLLSPELNAEDYTKVQVMDTEKNLVSAESISLLSGTDYQMATWPVELEPDSYYEVEVKLSSEAEDARFYVDFAADGYDNAEQEHQFVLNKGSHSYHTLLFTGDCGGISNIQFRIVALTMEPIQIESVRVDKVSVMEEQQYKLKSTGDYNIYENLNAKELFYTPRQVAPISEEERTQLYTQTENYDILNTSYLTDVDKAHDFSQVQTEVRDIELHNNCATAEVIADGDCFLNFSQTYYPGWKAYVDGQETEVYMVNGIIQGIFVPEGTHTVEFRFVPTIFYIGLAVSGLTIVACVSYSIYEQKKYGRKPV